MGACDGLRRLEPVAPAVGDRPSIGDEGHPRQSEWRDTAAGPEAGTRELSVTTFLDRSFPILLRIRGLPAILAVREFRTLWWAHVISCLGDQIAQVAIALLGTGFPGGRDPEGDPGVRTDRSPWTLCRSACRPWSRSLESWTSRRRQNRPPNGPPPRPPRRVANERRLAAVAAGGPSVGTCQR